MTNKILKSYLVLKFVPLAIFLTCWPIGFGETMTNSTHPNDAIPALGAAFPSWTTQGASYRSIESTGPITYRGIKYPYSDRFFYDFPRALFAENRSATMLNAVAGHPFKINYARLPKEIGGSGALTKLTVFARFNDGSIQSYDSPGYRCGHSEEEQCAEVAIPIPTDAFGQLEFWMKITTKNGEEFFDTRSQANYFTSILSVPDSHILFATEQRSAENPPPQQTGILKAGSTVAISYDRARLDRLGAPCIERFGNKLCPGFRGLITFFATDGTERQQITISPSANRASLIPVQIPVGVTRMNLAFESIYSFDTTIKAHDNNAGTEFSFEIEP